MVDIVVCIVVGMQSRSRRLCQRLGDLGRCLLLSTLIVGMVVGIVGSVVVGEVEDVVVEKIGRRGE